MWPVAAAEIRKRFGIRAPFAAERQRELECGADCRCIEQGSSSTASTDVRYS